MFYQSVFATALALLPGVLGQLSDPSAVSPLTTFAAKKAVKNCDITDYGATADGTTDISTALNSAFTACKSGGVVTIPTGTFALGTWVTMSGGSAWAIDLQGTIVRTGTADGNMIYIEHTTDFEFTSSTGTGAIQGYGYVFHAQGEYGPRLLRLYEAEHWSIHDIALVDSPQFHLTLDTCTNGVVYNTIIRGANEGGLDGIDVSGSNIWIHDVEVTNKDECVTVKDPSNNLLMENIYCNWSGGCAMGSLGADTNISSIQYSNVYTVNSNQMFMFKSNGGSGTVSNVLLENFIGHENAYSLDINAYWTEETAADGDGILYTDITFNNWKGDAANGAERAPINIICPDDVPCTDITIEDFAIWTDSGSTEYYKCAQAYGTGGCLRSGTATTAYGSTTSTITATPSGWSAATMPSDLATGFGLSTSIDIPAIPTTFYPGATPATARIA